MARLGKIYTGPQISLGRRLMLRYPGSIGSLLFLTFIGLPFLTAITGPRLSNGGGAAVVALCLVAALASKVGIEFWASQERERLLKQLPLPQFLKRKLRDTYPDLTQKDAELVERGLRQFFLACLRSKGKFVAMPSRVVDSMWHEFILHTRAYREWCDLAIGRFVDHVPAEAMGKKASTNDGLRRAWYWACSDEAIRPRNPTRLPLLFALDLKLRIPNGFHYLPDCKKNSNGTPLNGVYCGESFADASYSGEADDFGGADAGSSADGGSDGGCGGGCGGGGD